jgi:hypothetical protein
LNVSPKISGEQPRLSPTREEDYGGQNAASQNTQL